MARNGRNVVHSRQGSIAARIADARSMSAAVLTKVAPTASTRILADVSALVASERPQGVRSRTPRAGDGRDFADRLVAALSEKSGSARR